MNTSANKDAGIVSVFAYTRNPFRNTNNRKRLVDDPSHIGKWLKEGREKAKISQADAAKAVGVHKMTLSKWERGVQRVPASAMATLMGLYGLWLDDLVGVSGNGHRVSENVPRGTYGRLPPRAYEVAHKYLEQMKTVGCSPEQIDEAMRLMVEGAFNKINKRDPRERSEEDLITDIDAAWDFIRAVLRKEGKRL